MERVTKVYFDPLLASKKLIKALLVTLPVGSAHPFKHDGVLLHHSAINVVTEIDISMHPDEYFSNTVNLAELGEDTLERIKLFPELQNFSEEYMIQQAPSSIFQVPLVDNAITIFAVSKRAPTFYDLCIANSGHRTSCYNAISTFPGVTHSGDINKGLFLLHHIKIESGSLQESEYVLFVSGYNHTLLTKYKEENPLVLVANHQEKVLYVVPVPLDTASIGDAILCCPMAIRADKASNTLICSILPTPTTDNNLMCSGSSLPSPSFAQAVERADFNLEPPRANPVTESAELIMTGVEFSSNLKSSLNPISSHLPKQYHLILATENVNIHNVEHFEHSQIIRFGNGIEWIDGDETPPLDEKPASVLPCILGGILEGPLLLATGVAPRNLPFDREILLHNFYRSAVTVTVIVDQTMTDNARNLATTWRINALFIVQAIGDEVKVDADILSFLEGLNINAVTALAGPQSLILAQVGDRYHYYRGIANHDCFSAVDMKFGQDITETLQTVDFKKMINSKWPRIINLSEPNKIFLPSAKLELLPIDLLGIFERTSLAELQSLREDILTAVPQLQALMKQKDLEELCSKIIAIIEAKVVSTTAEKKKSYVQFFTKVYKPGNTELKKEKDRLLADLRRTTKDAQSSIDWLVQALGNIVSSQNTSTKKHDLKRMIRKSAIRSNVDAVKNMTFDSIAGLLEEYAAEMGVLLVNINTDSYLQLLRNPSFATISAISCCTLDSRILHLEGLDAGIVLEQSQNNHAGPLVSQNGLSQPILALPYLSEQEDTGSMLAWVCWDEFVNLEDPSTIRWVEKCNEAHIAALRIIMRATLCTAVSSRDNDMNSASVQTGQLMGSLLMASMKKLTQMRTTTPQPTIIASDTITKLMRGLFGHLLTIAGSGVKPLSLVWQLMGTNPQIDVPIKDAAWDWYENVTSLYPYTGWPLETLSRNLEKLLDKIFFRMITNNKLPDAAYQSRVRQEKAMRLHNLWLAQSRNIWFCILKILSAENDSERLARNMLRVLPKPVEKEKGAYTILYQYVERLSQGAKDWHWGNVVAANLYTRRAGDFRNLKKELSEAIEGEDKVEVEVLCQKIVDKWEATASTWRLEPIALKVQCIQNVQAIRSMLSSLDLSEVRKNKDIYMRVKGDAEQWREPWQVGNGRYGKLGPLNVEAVTQIMNDTTSQAMIDQMVSIGDRDEADEDEWMQFEKVVKPDFLRKVKDLSTYGGVCQMLKIPESMMRVFILTLAPQYQLERLPESFREAVLTLLRNPNQETAKPTQNLFRLQRIEGLN